MSADELERASRVAVTGASGFVGGALVKLLSAHDNFEPVAIYRASPERLPLGCETFVCGDLTPYTDFTAALKGVDSVVHCAARVHVMDERAADPMAEFRLANVAATHNLAKQAAQCGVTRFVFISSIKVNGESTEPGHAYRADDVPMPSDIYGVSKMEAEEGLRSIAAETGMDVVIIRPVLVYGPGVKANFFNMMRWLSKGIILPFGAINNRRSLVSLYNLVDLISVCLEHPAAANQTFLVSDGEDVSTTQLLKRMSNALHCRARLLPVPSSLLVAAARILNKKPLSQRLCGNLQVDIEKNRLLLGWTPPMSVEQGFALTAESFQGRTDK
ncbi:NAD-dependent dehydratase [Pseudomonas sp. S10E 269]|uniref:UDP-glucose 4-epimerase family protein n=1 Tax=unclassified Pseudomonas TaxID=196821 RepID=UPI000C259053|nr:MULTISPECIES: SDR family oxidoreductase [unclassified Pseudomonas]PJK34022.1 NAD-dependent dehydratase [Pseudomonas sp. S09F 262]PJK37963.1 NAD-dependent dehydratase [Pseudomonas sp. S10E 269]